MARYDNDRSSGFVAHVLQRAKVDTGFAARMRRADNTDTEYQAWGELAAFNVNLELDRERLPFSIVGAALCREKPEQDGKYSIGASLASCFEQTPGNPGDNPGVSRLRRILACNTIREICQVLRPMLHFVAEKSTRPLSYAGLLRDLLFFESANGSRIKRRWAMDFFGQPQEQDGVKPESTGQ